MLKVSLDNCLGDRSCNRAPLVLVSRWLVLDQHGDGDLRVRHGREGDEPGFDIRAGGLRRPRLARYLHAGDACLHACAMRAVYHREHQAGELGRRTTRSSTEPWTWLVGHHRLALSVGGVGE